MTKIHSPKFCPLGKFLIVFLWKVPLRGLHCSTDSLKWQSSASLETCSATFLLHQLVKNLRPLLEDKRCWCYHGKWQGMLLTRHMLNPIPFLSDNGLLMLWYIWTNPVYNEHCDSIVTSYTTDKFQDFSSLLQMLWPSRTCKSTLRLPFWGLPLILYDASFLYRYFLHYHRVLQAMRSKLLWTAMLL